MPLFAYICKACGARPELLSRADEEVTCPACGSKQMERQLSHFAPMSGHGHAQEPACASQCAMAQGGCCPSSGCMH
jgi:putative FmdB family regulatory protein